MCVDRGDNMKVQLYEFYNDFIEPKSISPPSLKKLELEDLGINENFMRMILLGCPALEELNLEHCQIFAHEISSPILKKLSLTTFFQETAIHISCSAVVSLKIYSSNAGGIILKNMSSLVKAKILIEKEDYFQTFIEKDLALLGGLSNVTTLVVTITREVLIY